MRDEESDARKNQSISDAECELAAQALHEFEQKNFGQCLGYLKKLMGKRPQDAKVFHNYFVAEYYLSNCTLTGELRKEMAQICKQAHLDVDDSESLEDVDNCVVLYNKAVVSFHFHQYHSAIFLLDKAFQYIEPLEENLAKNICFLLLESYLCIYQPKKALSVIGCIDNLFNKSKSTQKENVKDENYESCLSEPYKRRLQLCKARCYAMMKTSKACKKEIKNLMVSGSSVENIPALYLKSQLEYQRGNYRKALKLLNSITLPENVSQYFRKTGDCLPAIFYNNVGCIHFYMGKPSLGQFYMTKSINALDSELHSVTDLKDTEISNNSRPLHLLCMSTRHQLVYNLGMQFMQAQKWEKAFDCFVEVVQSYHSNPRLWLRIAECCIHANKPDNNDQFVEYKAKSFIKSVVGAGIYRKVIINSSSSNKVLHEDSKSISFSATPKPTLHFAMLCLKNAFHLVGEGESNHADDSGDSDSPAVVEEADSADETILPLLPSNFIQGHQIQCLRNSILVASSYVALSLGDAILAHEYAQALLNQPRHSASHKYLAHLYAGESLLIMDRITEAVEHLNTQYGSDIELSFPGSASEGSLRHQMRFDPSEKNDDGSRPVGNIPNWFPSTISSAKFIAQYNLAVAYAVREEWSKASECLSQMNPKGPVPPQASSLLIYVQLHQGSAKDVKRYFRKCTLSRNDA